MLNQGSAALCKSWANFPTKNRFWATLFIKKPLSAAYNLKE